MKIQDLYIPNVDEMEKEIAYGRFRHEKEEIICKHWKRLYQDQSKTIEEVTSYLNYNLMSVKEAEIEVRTSKALDGEHQMYAKILEDQIESIRKQLDQRKIFNPLEVRILVNPLIEMRQRAAKLYHDNKAKLLKLQKENLRPKKFSEHAQTELQNVEYDLVQLPKGRTLEDLKPPKKVAECQATPVTKVREVQVNFTDLCEGGNIYGQVLMSAETQTDLGMDHVLSKEEADQIREGQIPRNIRDVVYNQEHGEGQEFSSEPASALEPVEEAQKKRNAKKKMAG